MIYGSNLILRTRSSSFTSASEIYFNILPIFEGDNYEFLWEARRSLILKINHGSPGKGFYYVIWILLINNSNHSFNQLIFIDNYYVRDTFGRHWAHRGTQDKIQSLPCPHRARTRRGRSLERAASQPCGPPFPGKYRQRGESAPQALIQPGDSGYQERSGWRPDHGRINITKTPLNCISSTAWCKCQGFISTKNSLT